MTDVIRLSPLRDKAVMEGVCEILQKHNPREVSLERTTRITSELNLDSVEIMDLMMEIEQKFDIDVPISLLSDVETIGDLVDLVGSRVEGK